MSNFCAESSIVHEENVQVADIMNEEFFKTIGQVESGFLIASVTDLGHGLVASKSSSHSVVDTWVSKSTTSGSSPTGSQSTAVQV